VIFGVISSLIPIVKAHLSLIYDIIGASVIYCLWAENSICSWNKSPEEEEKNA